MHVKLPLMYHIEIAGWDPARSVIAAEIAHRGGRPINGGSLTYGFRNAEHRDRVLRDIRGCYGTDCAFGREATG